MGGLDAHAHRAASGEQTPARMAIGSRDNGFAMVTPLLLDYSMRTWYGRIIMLPTSLCARRPADWSRVG